MPLSAVVLTHNSEKTIERSLAGLAFCDEIIVADDNSTDNTVAVAQKFTQKIWQHPLNGDFSAQRNWVMGQTAHDWVLFVDSDEIVTPELQNEIKNLPLEQNKDTVCYRLKRIDMFMGQKVTHGELAKAAHQGIIRLVRKGTGSWNGAVHEEWVASGNVGTLINPLFHEPHQSIAEFLREVNMYSNLRAKELYKAKKKTSWFELLAFPFGKFFYTYFIKMGFLDGPPGFIYSFMMSFHSFLVRAKLFQYYLDEKPVPAAHK